MPTADTTTDRPGEEHRSILTAAVLVGLVVLILGFGSGIGAVWERDASSPSAAAPSSTSVPRSISSVVSPGQTTGSIGGRVGASRLLGSTAPAATTPTTTPVNHTAGPTTTTTTTSEAPRGETPSCETTNLVAAVASPFWAHFEAAHLETSVGQQADDALDLDSYVLAHTVLIEHMLAPVLELLAALPEALDPFVAHVDAAHLETSVGQQIAEALQVDQYVTTHTVLVEHMLAPAAGVVTASGC